MNDLLQYNQAEATILSYKLDKIRKHIEKRMETVDAITKNELQAILMIISQYEVVPAGWSLKDPLVIIPDEVKDDVQ